MPRAVSPRTAAQSPLAKIWADLGYQRSAGRRHPYPSGPTGLGPTFTFLRDPLGVLLPAYEQYGPVFTMRGLHMKLVWALGPEAQHQILVSEADKFHWREGLYRELIPLLGDGLISTDEEYHDRSRRLMLPLFHTERLASATRTMAAEADRAIAGLAGQDSFEAYEWARELGMRVAMAALFGFDPDRSDAGRTVSDFEAALSFYGNDIPYWMLRGPHTPYAKLRAARGRIAATVFEEIARRRRAGTAGEDILSLLMNAHDDDGWRFTDTQLLDHALTLLFAGHDTTATTVALTLHELARHPDWLRQVTTELDSEVGDEFATEEQLFSGLPVLEQVIDETLRLYPPVPGGLRRAVEDVEIAGVPIPAGASVQYSSWASHRLADVFPDPHQFRPERMTRDEKAKLRKGAYVPFGGGRRICIGKRFGYLEAKVILSRLVRKTTIAPANNEPLQVKWSATLIPVNGIPLRLTSR